LQLDARASTERLGTTIGGRWRLERILGVGASATVFAATDPAGQRAAVKVLHTGALVDEEVRARFAREAALVARLDHPGIVRLLDHDTSDPAAAYLAMELLAGETLGARAARLGTIPLGELLAIAEQVLDALAAAHGAGVVHRDLKPENVFVTTDGSVRLLDFGIARLLGPSRGPGTRASLTLGTAAYMSPEQAQGRNDEVDARTDLFALGAILFRLLSGRRLHEARTDAELIAAMATRPAPAFATVCPEAPRDLAAVIDTALGFDRQARYPDAATMRRDVQAVRTGQAPPHARSRLVAAAMPTVASGILDASPREATPAPSAPAGTAAPAAPAPEAGGEALDRVGTTIAGRYRIDRLLGSGGMGAVYRAEHVLMRKTVALKVLHREMTLVPEVVARFEREAFAASRIDHPNVVAATDFGQLEDGGFYLVLEFVEGRSLRAVLDAEGALAPDRAARIAAQIASALAEAHAQGIVHRDLKPDNVMLIERPENPEHVKVLDFGIAKVTANDLAGQPALTRFGSVFGTPEYMSPEQAMGTTVDHRADLYALGVLLYEMLAGETPFHDDDLMALLARQMTAPPPPLPASVPPALRAVVDRLLAKRPEERPPSADAVVAALAPLAGVGGARPAPAGLAALARPAPPAAAFGAATAPWKLWLRDAARRTLVATRRALAASGPALAALRGALLRPARLGGRTLPGWALVLAALALVLGGVLGVTLLAPGPAPVAGLAAASANDRSGAAASARRIAIIQARPEAERTGSDWRALALEHAAHEDLGSALNATRRALAAEPRLAKDPALVALVRRAADDPEQVVRALDLAADLGSAGADVLYDVWRAAQGDPTRRTAATLAEERLARPEVRSQASEALAIALELRPGKTCLEYKKLMPKAVEHADARAEPYLAKLAKKELCRGGRFSFRQFDCWACLRPEATLPAALERARRTPAPRFDAAPTP